MLHWGRPPVRPPARFACPPVDGRQRSEREQEELLKGHPKGVPKVGIKLVKKVAAMLASPQGGHAAMLRVAAREARPFLAVDVAACLRGNADRKAVDDLSGVQGLLEPLLREFLTPGGLAQPQAAGADAA